ncbi:MAG: serine hydrolase domain-containing protein [Nocardioides sp.]
MKISSAGMSAIVVAGLMLATAPAITTAADGAVPATAAASDATQLQRTLDRMVEHGAPGALLYTYDHGQVTELQSGVADLATGEPLRPDDSYRIGSLTKTYVSTAVLDLVAKHRIRLKDPVRRYLPGFLNGGPPVTVRQLLNHTSGLYEFNDDPRVLAPYLAGDLGHVWTPQQLVRLALTHDSVSAPGAEYHYSNTNYLLAGLLVQAVTGHRLENVLAHRVFSRAHLEATTFTPSTTLPAPAAHGYFVFSGDEPTDITGLYPYPWASGSAVSTAPDVARFYRSLLSGDLLPRRQLDLMRTTVDASAEDGPGTSYGLGLERFPTPCGAAWGHGGNFPGYVTYVYSSPDGGRQTVLLVNEDPKSLAPSVGRDFLRVLDQAYCAS